jgi:hypothetical protein
VSILTPQKSLRIILKKICSSSAPEHQFSWPVFSLSIFFSPFSKSQTPKNQKATFAMMIVCKNPKQTEEATDSCARSHPCG